MLIEGAVEVRKGEQPVASVREPGALFGEMAILLGTPHTASVVATEPSRLYVIEDPQVFLASPGILLHVSQLLEMASGLEIENANRLRKQELMFAILKKRAKGGEQIFGDGTLEVLPDGFGFLRSPETSYLASTDDIYISPSQIRRFNLHTGDTIEGEIRTPKDGERYFALVKVDKVNGEPPENAKNKILFENLTPLFPDEVMVLERDIKAEENITGRIIDIIAPIGKGQRGLLVSSPKSGKTVMLQHVAHAITANHPDVILIVLLIDERPEEVTEMQRTVRGEVVASTFDAPLPPTMTQRFRQVAGLDLLVVRPPLWDVRNGDMTSSGRADTVPFSGGDWREGDRMFLRIPAAQLAQGVPGIVLGWKDRTLQTDPDAEFPRRSSLPFPVVR